MFPITATLRMRLGLSISPARNSVEYYASQLALAKHDCLRNALFEDGEGLLAKRLHQRLLNVLCIFFLHQHFRSLEHLHVEEKALALHPPRRDSTVCLRIASPRFRRFGYLNLPAGLRFCHVRHPAPLPPTLILLVHVPILLLLILLQGKTVEIAKTPTLTLSSSESFTSGPM